MKKKLILLMILLLIIFFISTVVLSILYSHSKIGVLDILAKKITKENQLKGFDLGLINQLDLVYIDQKPYIYYSLIDSGSAAAEAIQGLIAKDYKMYWIEYIGAYSGMQGIMDTIPTADAKESPGLRDNKDIYYYLVDRAKIKNGRLPLVVDDNSQNTFADSDFVTSSDKNFTTFIRDVGKNKPSNDFALGIDNYNQLVLRDLHNLKEEIIVESGSIVNLKVLNLPDVFIDKIINISSPVFSLDGNKIYFLASAWLTSDAVFSVDIKTKEIRYIADGNSVDIVKNGNDKGDLIINQREVLCVDNCDNTGVTYCDYLVNPDSGERIKDLNHCW